MSDVKDSCKKGNTDKILETPDETCQDDTVDPRVQIELERLNSATDLINKLEIELDEARSNFRILLTDSSVRVNHLAKRLGSCVEKARPYYEARMRAKQLQTQTQKAALRYERASSAHAAAKEMVYLAEEGLKKEGRCFDPAWQEMLNHATLRVNEAESERVLSQHEHQKTSLAYNDAEKVVQKLHQELKKSIVKSSLSTRRSLLQLNNLANQHQLQLLPYFEMKAQFNQLLEEQRKKVHLLEENVLKVKMSYADALHNLEEISDEIHEKRKIKENTNLHDEDGSTENSSYMWNGIEIPYHKLHSNSTSWEEIYYDNINSEDAYMSLPSKLKVRPGVVNTTCCNIESKPELSKVCLSESVESSAHDPKSRTLLQKFDSNEAVLCDSVSDVGKGDDQSESKNSQEMLLVSKRLGLLSVINGESRVSHDKSVNKGRSPNGEVPEHKLTATDFNILRVQREEISDSESLASNDTADTLDDNQIECLLLDKVLPLDVENDVECSSLSQE